jgi:hypothetical protein
MENIKVRYLLTAEIKINENDVFEQDGVKFFIFEKESGNYSTVEFYTGIKIANGKIREKLIETAKDIVFDKYKTETQEIVYNAQRLKITIN